MLHPCQIHYDAGIAQGDKYMRALASLFAIRNDLVEYQLNKISACGDWRDEGCCFMECSEVCLSLRCFGVHLHNLSNIKV